MYNDTLMTTQNHWSLSWLLDENDEGYWSRTSCCKQLRNIIELEYFGTKKKNYMSLQTMLWCHKARLYALFWLLRCQTMLWHHNWSRIICCDQSNLNNAVMPQSNFFWHNIPGHFIVQVTRTTIIVTSQHIYHEFHETGHSFTFYFMKKDSKWCCDTTTSESIHTKDESKRDSAFAFIFGVNWPVQWM